MTSTKISHIIRMEKEDHEFLYNKGYNISKLGRRLVSDYVAQERKKEEFLNAIQPNTTTRTD